MKLKLYIVMLFLLLNLNHLVHKLFSCIMHTAIFENRSQSTILLSGAAVYVDLYLCCCVAAGT
jgi:hypothetical protein